MPNNTHLPKSYRRRLDQRRRNPYRPEQHSTKQTPLTASRPLGPFRRFLRDVLLAWVGRLQGHPVWPSPLDQFFALQDEAGRIYVWTVRGDDEEVALTIAERFNEEFLRKFHRPPRAFHLVTTDIESIRPLSREEVDALRGPWLTEEDKP